ncbi:hypothetical protein EVAR_43776_1 [Eumeta japonica]|uniref:Uncharacterized protein n=1 Tax=Eumeta variegata TaxID=151549 RepID=A0A4C1XGK8_EUMVA|nr:hypothetical protein EVAR_43776_1 [Eumeta japonica]
MDLSDVLIIDVPEEKLTATLITHDSVTSDTQCVWDEIGYKITLDRLLKKAPDATNEAKPTAALTSESGAWLQVLPSPNFCTLMDYNYFRVVVAFHSGWYVCEPHLSSHLNSASRAAVSGAVPDAKQKYLEYSILKDTYLFMPVACEKGGPWDSKEKPFTRDLDRRLKNKGGSSRSGSYLFQNLCCYPTRQCCYYDGDLQTRPDQKRHLGHARGEVLEAGVEQCRDYGPELSDNNGDFYFTYAFCENVVSHLIESVRYRDTSEFTTARFYYLVFLARGMVKDHSGKKNQ